MSNDVIVVLEMISSKGISNATVTCSNMQQATEIINNYEEPLRFGDHGSYHHGDSIYRRGFVVWNGTDPKFQPEPSLETAPTDLSSIPNTDPHEPTGGKEEWKIQVVDLIHEMRAREYYLPLWKGTLSRYHLTEDDLIFGKVEYKTVIELLDDFWNALPDSPEIRTVPFFLLCDIIDSR